VGRSIAAGTLTPAAAGGRVTGKGGPMAYSIRCADAGVDCPGSFTTETKDELMKHVELHASEAHPDLELEPSQIEALVKSA
jgi:predicted small metal-binding protein